ncbi:MAG: outer membrane protein assembly factor BamD [bacterium]
MKKVFVISLVLFVFTACGTKQTLSPLDPDEAFERAVSFFKQEDYSKAVLAFEQILFYHPSSEYVDDAQYWLGRTYFEQKDYDQAIVEFDYLIKNFPTSGFVEEAYLFRVKAYLEKAPGFEKDPTGIENAILFCDRFLTHFPNSKYTDEIKEMILVARNRLAKKGTENGKIYLKLGEPKAALLYFNYVIETYPETQFSSEAKYQAAEIYQSMDKKDKALTLYKELFDEDPWREKVAKKIEQLEKK